MLFLYYGDQTGCGIMAMVSQSRTTVRASVSIAQNTLGPSLLPGLTPGSCSALCPAGSTFSAEQLPSQAGLSQCHCQQLFLHRCMTWHLSLLNYIWFPLSHSSSLSRDAWVAALPLRVSLGAPQTVVLCQPDQSVLQCPLPTPLLGH